MKINNNLNSNWVTGFYDAEGCFSLSVYQNKTSKIGWTVALKVQVTQKVTSIFVLESIKIFFGGYGSILTTNKEKTIARYQLTGIENVMKIVIPHFVKYPLLTSKFLNFDDFRKAALIIQAGEHLTIEGINRLKIISAGMNTNRPFIDKWEHCKNNLNLSMFTPEWVQAFVDGEGSFQFYLGNNSCIFSIAQHVSDYYVLKHIAEFFPGSVIYPKIDTLESVETYIKKCQELSYKKSPVLELKITSKNLHKSVIVPFFEAYPLYTTKALDFADWKKLIEMTDAKYYNLININGRAELLRISKGMNRGRIFKK